MKISKQVTVEFENEEVRWVRIVFQHYNNDHGLNPYHREDFKQFVSDTIMKINEAYDKED